MTLPVARQPASSSPGPGPHQGSGRHGRRRGRRSRARAKAAPQARAAAPESPAGPRRGRLDRALPVRAGARVPPTPGGGPRLGATPLKLAASSDSIRVGDAVTKQTAARAIGLSFGLRVMHDASHCDRAKH